MIAPTIMSMGDKDGSISLIVLRLSPKDKVLHPD
jgi:hypothetical protein